MRFLPFTKNKGGVQFAGLGYGDSGGDGYTLLPATTETLGGVKVGSGLDVDEDGTLSTSGGAGINIGNDETIVGTFNEKILYAKSRTGSMGAFQIFFNIGQHTNVVDIFGTIQNGTGSPFYNLGAFGSYLNVNSDGDVVMQAAPSGWNNTIGTITVLYTKD